MSGQLPRVPSSRGTRRFLVGFAGIALLLAAVVSFYASGQPDGLEFVAESTGFLDTAKDSATAGSPLADYGVQGVDDSRLSVALAGVIGVVVTLLLAGGLAAVLRPRSTDPDSAA